MKNIAFITTCMGRLEHALQSSDSLMQDPRINGVQNHYVFVDFACPQNSGKIIKARHPTATVVHLPAKNIKEDEEVVFHKSLAQNIGASHAKLKADYFVFIDADTKVSTALLDFVFKNASDDQFMVMLPPKKLRDLCGFLGVPSRAFYAVEGFDYQIIGWGGVDLDMRLRLFLNGLPWTEAPFELASAIHHTDELRTRFSPFKTTTESYSRNMKILKNNVQHCSGSSCHRLLETSIGSDIKTLLGLPRPE